MTTTHSTALAPVIAQPVATDWKGRPYRCAVYTLSEPAGARRVWRNESDGTFRVRDLGGFGPKGHLPVGYVAHETIILDPGVHLSGADVHFLATYYACWPDARPAPMSAAEFTDRFPRSGGGCIRCGLPSGYPHATDCRHAGKEVGDVVR